MASVRESRWAHALLVVGMLGCGEKEPSSSCSQLGQQLCPNPASGGEVCIYTVADSNNCGACGNVCGADRYCQSGSCICLTGWQECGTGVCHNLQSDSAHCGNCAGTCQGDKPYCNSGVCSASCAAGLIACGTSCVNTTTDVAHCGACNRPCSGTCNLGVCIPRAGTAAGAGGSGAINQGISARGGASGGAGAGGSAIGTSGPRPNGCPVSEGMISDFEEGTGAPAVLPETGISGAWEAFHNSASDGAVGTQTIAVESSGETAECKKYALHTSGSGWGSGTTGWVGIGLTHMAGTATAPAIYPNSKKYIGIKFRAKLGPTHASNSLVRVNISTPDTEGTGSKGSCTSIGSSAEKAARPCYQHVGRFLQEEYALTTSWKEIALCFDRDLYPLSLPSNLSNSQRDSIASHLLKIQFQFNQGKEWNVSTYPAQGKFVEIAKTAAFDFWVDDIQFISGECPNNQLFSSTTGSAKKFPQNSSGGSCAIATNAANFNCAISQAYARWTKTFVRSEGANLKVIAPEQENGVTTSEAMGYGMLIAAAMGDQTTFDKMWGYVKGQLSGGLMTWKTGSSGSATDGDEDIAYALLIANTQWPSGGYKSAADSMAAAILSGDVDSNSVIKGGNGWRGPFNPSYFAPAAYRQFSGFTSVVTKGYQLVNANISSPTAGLPTDWGNATTGAPSDHGDAQVTSELPGIVYGYDAARVPWRLGLDVCSGGGTDANISLNSIVSFFAAKYDNGDSIDLLKAGWDKTTGSVATNAKDMQGSFIGPVGVAGMAVGGAAGGKIRDRAFRAILDILENGDFNHTYFPSTVGLLTLLAMSGNFPMP
jgi:endo-1,4-beta-D-glucanase Y